MATRAFSTFVAQLLAPLPMAVEPMRTPRLDRAEAREIRDGWRHRQLVMWQLEAEHNAARWVQTLAWEFQQGLPEVAKVRVKTSFERYRAAHDSLMLFPAPSIGHLRWKQKQRLARNPAWAEVIAQDEIRLAAARHH